MPRGENGRETRHHPEPSDDNPHALTKATTPLFATPLPLVFRRAENLAGLARNALWFWWPGYEMRKWVGKETLPINHGRMVDELIDVHGHEIFVDGYFNADPHPGNMLLLNRKTGSPRIGLIDYGQVKELSREVRGRV
jgi:hypothetical protein